MERIKTEISDELLVSVEAVSNPKVYRFLREALDSRGVQVPASVIDTIAGSFVAKRIIAAIWKEDD